MKTTRYTLLAAALLLAASCANDPVEDIINPSAPGAALPGGTFVIDYTAGMEGADTRNDLPANQRIQSLDYLIYQSDSENGTYTLLKKRPISDINETTVWPLTRKDMTWAQREDLKDTLSTDKYYKMVFVANADDKIWNEEDTPEENMFHALQNVKEGTSTSSTASTYEEGRLVLPPNGQFEDNNMYYMATLAVDGNDYATDEDKTATLTITLQRMINKVEVKLADDVVNGIQEKRSVDEYVESKLANIYKTKYINGGLTHEVVTEYMSGIATAMRQDANEVINKYSAQYKDKDEFAKIMENTENYVLVTNYLSSCTEENHCTDKEVCIKHSFIEEYKESFSTQCDWSDVSYIEISYTANSSPYAIDFNKKTLSDASTLTLKVEKTQNNNIYDNRFIFYTFGNSDIANNSINKINTITFYTEEDTQFSSTCNTTPGITADETVLNGNWHFVLEYNPIDNIVESETETFTFQRNNFNLQELLKWNLEDSKWEWGAANLGWQRPDMNNWINSHFSKSGDTTQFTPYLLELDIPEIVINAPWYTGKAGSV